MASKRNIQTKRDPDGKQTVTVRGVIMGHVRRIQRSQGFIATGCSDKSAGAVVRYALAIVAQANRDARKPRRLVRLNTEGGG